MAQKPKTPEYTRRAINSYHAKHDRLQLTLDLGELERLRSVGLDNDGIRELIRKEYAKRTKS